ncbi:hypothetical protein SAMN05444377_11096 [Flavobacterium fontis]|jgi:hypothetical protein|uniref:Lipocalin-like domain-containing protein n=1 Tax=Flavobacterium fontis TaxID=1124188 RepID=A0A1M5C4V3_9FLAO|nr:hypothetical protein [Flavobacterium fontis]SHF49462.1 hypothetical protein SAMN05444377_11096 [Flavobacterium fontis]
MKKLKILMLLCLVFLVNVASMCSNDDDNSTSSVNQTTVVNTVSSGTWRITLYNDSGTIKTNQFTGYNFTFGPSNVLTATNGTQTYTGVWSVTDSNSNDDSMDDLDFNIAFTAPANFLELTDDWDIQSRTDTKIELIDISGGNGGTDYLTFEKN